MISVSVQSMYSCSLFLRIFHCKGKPSLGTGFTTWPDLEVAAVELAVAERRCTRFHRMMLPCGVCTSYVRLIAGRTTVPCIHCLSPRLVGFILTVSPSCNGGTSRALRLYRVACAICRCLRMVLVSGIAVGVSRDLAVGMMVLAHRDIISWTGLRRMPGHGVSLRFSNAW